MASTIKLKRGSGVPTSGTLAAGELGLDLTNKKIYSSTDGTDVVELADSTSITVDSGVVLTVNRTTDDGNVVEFEQDGANFGAIGLGTATASTASDMFVVNSEFGLRFFRSTDNTVKAIFPVGNTGSFYNHQLDLGIGGSGWDDIYAANGTIQTSDESEKQYISELSDAEKAVAVKCKGLIRKYRWKDAVAEKGDDARIHFGIIAQDLKAAFESEGLDAGDYGVFISSTWIDDDGVEQTRLGVRYNELFAFILAAL